MGWGSKSNTNSFAVRSPEKGAREYFALLNIKGNLNLKQIVIKSSRSEHEPLNYPQSISSLWNCNSELNV